MDANSMEDISFLGRWRLSSYKEEYGLENLLDASTERYWQSDGEFPHYVEIQFSKLVQVARIDFFCASATDSSYAPKDISIEAGFGPHELLPVKRISFGNDKINKEWFTIPLNDLGTSHTEILECTTLRFNIDMNFFHGKDSHLRALRVLGPREKSKILRI